jgi:N-acetylmuramoyl-L-alanine amidase
LREGRDRVRFRDESVQSAAFAVLKSPDVPSVLLESGYINSEEDFARLTSETGKAGLAKVVARAMAVYFARRSLQ